ncbi:MAG: UDP-N-acetylmuramoyl-L-alanyl-D-glutamate--2,6-diaminopimelate ligase [Planctomycetia bacterium]|nr:UDP-N-acetylmuramoyl-L-alanyl-D-glutamate--2,6-diaminopimelate ligase [Planctomycetia bacterium]
MEYRATRVRGLSLRELLPDAQFLAADDIHVRSCSGDSRHCRPGDLFVALVGRDRDGHDFAAEAVARGASAVLASRPLGGIGVPTCFVPDTSVAYGLVCQALVDNPSRRLRVVGVTGTNGKTTTTHLIGGILAAAGYRLGMLGTLGYCDGAVVAPADHTTPPAPTLASWLARIEANGCTHAVLEVSSHALAQHRTAGVNIDVACVTNVRHDHYDFHGTHRRYVAAKSRILDLLPPEGVAIINADDPGSAACAARYDGPLVSVSIESPAEITATPLEQFTSEQTFILDTGSESVPVRTPLIGFHNISNCLVAAAVGMVYGIDLDTIVRGLESVRFVPGRLERLECGQPFGVFVDYAHTPDALATCLDTLRMVTQGRLICVFGAGGDRDRLKRPLMGRAVEERADLAVIANDNPRSEDPDGIAAEVRSGFEDISRGQIILDRASAIRWALDEAQAGDCVVIAGKGHEDYQEIGGDRVYFDDREVARHWLYESSLVDQMNRAA